MVYNVDIVLCMDATQDMHGIFVQAKDRAQNFYDDISRKMAEKQKAIGQLRVKCIVFRDIYDDPPELSMNCSKFFALPKELDAYQTFISEIKAQGGGSVEENGLEALALAINSEWSRGGDKRRHVIVLWTDAPAHKLERYEEEKARGQSLDHYPPNVPRTFSDLTDLWQAMDCGAKRLVFFAPDAYPWNVISDLWDNTILCTSELGDGLCDAKLQQILDIIVCAV